MAEKQTELHVGRFTILRRLGGGGMGAVYEGHYPALDRRVAIKTLTSDAIADAESRGRFEREARAAAKLAHPNIVTVYELGNFGGREKPYIVMEYLEGTDVAALISGSRGVPLAEELDIAAPLSPAPPVPRRRSDQDHGLRHRPGRRQSPDHQERRHDRHPPLHVAGADPRREARRQDRHLLRRLHPLRASRGCAAVLGRVRGLDSLQHRSRDAEAGGGGEFGSSPGGPAGHRPGALEEGRRSLRYRGR